MIWSIFVYIDDTMCNLYADDTLLIYIDIYVYIYSGPITTILPYIVQVAQYCPLVF